MIIYNYQKKLNKNKIFFKKWKIKYKSYKNKKLNQKNNGIIH